MVVVLLSAITVAALVWVVTVDTRAHRDAALDGALLRLEQWTSDRALAIERWVDSREQPLVITATFPTLRGLLAGAARGASVASPGEGSLGHLEGLLEAVRRVAGARAMTVVTCAGEPLAGVPESGRPSDAITAIGVRACNAGRGEAELVELDDGWALVVAAPVHTEGGDAILGAVVSLSEPGAGLAGLLASPEPGRADSTLVVRGPRVPAVRVELPGLPGPSSASPEMVFRCLDAVGPAASQWSGLVAGPDGSSWVGAAHRVPGREWWVVALCDADAVLRGALNRFHLQATALGLVLGGLFAVGLVHRRSRRIELERALHRAEAWVALVLEQSDLGIVVTDGAGVVRFASGGAGRLFARPREELVGRRFRSLCTDDGGVSDDSLHGERVTGSPATFELDGLRPDGTSFPMELVVRRVEDDGETLVLMLVRDVSLRRRNDLELRRKNEFISTILENLPLALTVNTIDDGEFLYVNPVFEQVYGWPRGRFETVDDAFRAMFPDAEERASTRRRIVDDIVRGGAHPSRWVNVEITTAAGERRYINAVGIPLYRQNLAIAAAQDVTEARRTRIHLAERERLAAVGELAAGIAHDFNNLLQVVLMNTELAMAASRAAPEVSHYLETVLGQSIRGADLIRQILDFARETALELRPMELEPILRESLAAVGSTLRHSVDVEVRVAAEALHVAADPTRIQQLVTNLVINASDAMPGGGRILVRLLPFDLPSTEEAPVAGMEPGRWVRLEVADEGIGMTSEVASRVFEPFFTTKPRTRGTGLGLALVYGIVVQHHGYIEVTSAPGRGAVFSVFLPRVEAMDAASLSPDDAVVRTPRGGGQTVLVVEDDEAIREAARQGLDVLGYRVLAVADGDAAFRTLAERGGAVDVMLSDLVMPGIDGTRLAREVRSRWPGVRIILMTGFAPDHDSGERLAAGIAACLHKPFTLSELARTIAHVLAQAPDADPDGDLSP